MVSNEERKAMIDYVASRLDGSGSIEPIIKELIPGIESSFIRVRDNGVVLLVDQAYPRDSFARLNEIARQSGKDNIGCVFFKDGETFFRSSVAGEDGNAGLHSMRSKQRDDRSLKHYDNEQLGKMITFRPEEIYVAGRRNGWIQYYQPASERLVEGLESFKFEPVHFDYSHIPAGQFKPADCNSKRLHIWTKRSHNDGPLTLNEGYLIRRDFGEGQHVQAQAGSGNAKQ